MLRAHGDTMPCKRNPVVISGGENVIFVVLGLFSPVNRTTLSASRTLAYFGATSHKSLLVSATPVRLSAPGRSRIVT
jgi:hypothetical protein